ncbi:hypothetical protein SAMN05421541_1184 [Actinoplanes philippinensis]|uniref:Uncharacterized protein n=1 Tax=Actinoplanes philippinensis TaxID=35752 RepID=A0A1I2KS03_9ACTN|nr:hypothetical protein [Actinoplanes philippinensis]SFF69030.1 hypothetical protein SAMN05421541_1184 [Actinoplanes philippinensis]
MLEERSGTIEPEYDLVRLSPKVRRALEGLRREATGVGQLNAFNSYAFVGESNKNDGFGMVTLEKAD